MSRNSVMSRILKELKTYSGLIASSLLCAVVVVVATLCIPVLTGNAVDCVIGKNNVDFEGLMLVLRKMTIAITLVAAFQWIMNLLNNKIIYNVTYEIRRKSFAKMEKLPFSTLDVHQRGDYMSRIVTDADGFSDGLLMGFNQLFTGIMTIVGTIAFMISISFPIALVVIVLTPLSLFVAKFVAKNTYDMFSAQAKIRGQQTSLSEEIIENADLVRAFDYSEEAINRYIAMNQELSIVSMKATFFSSLVNPTTRFINALIYAGVGALGAIMAINGTFTVGALTSFLTYASGYAKPFNEISSVITEFSNALACAKRLFEMMDESEEEETGEIELADVKGAVEFKNVSFSYNKDEKLIEDLNLRVEPGQKVAIVGPTGAGKSTIINLLMRFYDIDSGSITIDGIDISDIKRSSVRNNFGMVLQETWLKQGTIRDNLCLNKEASEDQLIAVAKDSYSHSFIKRLPKGYDTFLKNGDGGLSVGQKQLLCIGRIMMNLPPMLILDEATSSIDTRTEQKIQSAFNKMMAGRTTFVVAHRLSTIIGSDLILFVKDGKIVEQGTHDKLLQMNGLYAKLYQSQFQDNM